MIHEEHRALLVTPTRDFLALSQTEFEFQNFPNAWDSWTFKIFVGRFGFETGFAQVLRFGLGSFHLGFLGASRRAKVSGFGFDRALFGF